MTTKEKIAVMQAYEDGARIECKGRFGQWEDTNIPGWNFAHFDYRVKQEPFRQELLNVVTSSNYVNKSVFMLKIDLFVPREGEYKITVEEIVE